MANVTRGKLPTEDELVNVRTFMPEMECACGSSSSSPLTIAIAIKLAHACVYAQAAACVVRDGKDKKIDVNLSELFRGSGSDDLDIRMISVRGRACACLSHACI